ncbi:MAG: ferritin-like domain-containing protein [Bryobacteraceae bacterium]
MKLESLEELFLNQLKDVYDAEQQLIRSLPKVVQSVSSRELASAFERHAEESRNHVSRLERIFAQLDEKPKGRKCLGMQGIVEEAKAFLSQDAEAGTLDAGAIAIAQRAEHYEIACYGTLKAYAETLGHRQAVSFLDETLQEEIRMDKKLTSLAESSINPQAAEGAMGAGGRFDIE